MEELTKLKLIVYPKAISWNSAKYS